MSRSVRPTLVAVPLLALVFTLSAAFGEDLKPVDMTNRGTIKGRVTLPNPLPNQAAANKALRDKIDAHVDKKNCLEGKPDEIEQQTWRVSKDGGVANVVVYLRPQPGTYFKLAAEDLKPFQAKGGKSEVVMDQPHCAYIPHVAVAFPSYSDKDGKQVRTGQVFKIKNSAAMAHNSKWGGTRLNPGGNPNIPPGADVTLKELAADRFPIPVSCGMHLWMNAYIIALDHPFAAVTDENGNFEIKNVPAGVPLQILAWHEMGFASKDGFKGETITVPVGMTLEKNFQAKGP